ncbi:hypothetical protein CN234_17325 [Sinorhizobium meliloti]|uniref:hypothetical protein n=1 Tax=Rhizobium meliloti TaxID=382 RepID=UPI000FD7B723|nr:hypothetical protein [Sinorhizobium meliloti]RVG08543.1 hypothetical protein CN234_17325 [Sinorhizobium meliloti]
MAAVTELRSLSIGRDGSVSIDLVEIFGHFDGYAFCARDTDDENVSRIEINYMNKPLGARYAKFCARLRAARHNAGLLA